MNIEVFVAVLVALVTYRVLSPLIDAINPLANLNRPKTLGVEALILDPTSQRGVSDI